MDKMYFVTVTGLEHYYGKKPFNIGRKIQLVKEPENEFDSEAISVVLPYIGKIGYVANSVHTVYSGTVSAGRIYDKIGDRAYGIVMFVTHSSAIVLVPDDENDEAFKNEAAPAKGYVLKKKSKKNVKKKYSKV